MVICYMVYIYIYNILAMFGAEYLYYAGYLNK